MAAGRGKLGAVAAAGVLAILGTSCDAALPRVDPFAERALVDLIWENASDRRYFITIGDERDNTLSRWFVVEPCQKAGVWGVEVTMPDDVRIGEAGDAEAPSGPFGSGVDSVTLLDQPQWVFHIVQDDPPDDMLGNLLSYAPPQGRLEPFEAERLC